MPPLLRLPLLLLLLAPLSSATSNLASECADRRERDEEACSKPIGDVEPISQGSYYLAKVPCIDCPYTEHDRKNLDGSHTILEGDNDLLFNISLSRNNRTLLLNDKPVFPSLATNPHPPDVSTTQLPPNFTYTDLANALVCDAERQPGHWCIEPYLSRAYLNYDYFSKSLESNAETKTEKWEITFDAIAGKDMDVNKWWNIADSKQHKLRIIVQGIEVETDGRNDNKYQQGGGGGLFDDGMEEEEETLYDLTIVSVELAEREKAFSHRAPLTLWGRVRRFFGTDIIEANNHIVYVEDEWGFYGKNGSLRNYFGIFIYDWPWDLVFIIISSIIGGIIVIYGFYRFVLLVMKQRELARWDGMDAVWEQIRRERSDEEEDALLDGPYQDDPSEGSSGGGPSRYRDEATNKPLPSKPLPEKPLPEIPLIDA